MPIIALTLCTIFVLFLLRIDRKQYPDASLSLWLPTIWVLIATGKTLATWFGSSGNTMEEGSSLDRTFLILLLCLSFLILKQRNVKITAVLRENTPIVLFLVFMLISISWSDMPFVSLKRWTRNLIPIFMALIIASENDPRKGLECIFRRLIYINIPFSYVLIKFYPHLGRRYDAWKGTVMWIGATDQKNELTFVCMITIFYFVWAISRRRKGHDNSVAWYQIYLEVSIVFIAIFLFMGPYHTLTYSATTFTALTLALFIYFGLSWLRKYDIIISANKLMIFITAFILIGTVTPLVGHLPLFNPPEALNRDATLTGRTTIWNFLVPYAMQKPILGHGFGSFWTQEMRNATPVYPAHNGYLETILDLGFIGLFFSLVFLVDNCRRAQKLMTEDFDWGIFWFCLIFTTVLRNISESVIMSFATYMPGILIFITISLSGFRKNTNQ